jgi:AraC-like DNA-binding protein
MEQNVWTILITYATVQCFVLATVLMFREKGEAVQKKWLALVILLVGLQCLTFLYEYFQWYESAPHFIWISAPLWFLIGPALYFFSRNAIKRNTVFKWYDYFHFVPFIAAIVYIGRFYLLDGQTKISILTSFYNTYGQQPDYFLYSFLLSEFIYAFYSLYLFNQYFQKVGNEYSNSIIYQTRWIRFLLVSYIFFVLLSFIYNTVLLYDFEYYIHADYITYLFLAIVVQILGFSAILNPQSFFKTPIDFDKTYESKNHGEFEALFKQLRDHMNNKKPYMNPELRLSDLSRELDIPAHKLSQVINTMGDQNFFEFVNSYRVNEVKKRLPKSEYKHLTMTGIAEECGFNSSASFYRVFKEQTQMTPSQFLEKHTGR